MLPGSTAGRCHRQDARGPCALGRAGRLPHRPGAPRRDATPDGAVFVGPSRSTPPSWSGDRPRPGGDGPVIEERLLAWLAAGVRAWAAETGVPGELPQPELLAPRQKEHGDFASNIALAVAKRAARSPREVAQAIVDLPRARSVRPPCRGGRAGVHQRVRDARLAARRGPDDRGRGPAVRSRAGERPPCTGRVREREPHRAAHDRPRAQRRDRRRGRADPRLRRVGCATRVLLQRRGRADGPVRRLGVGPVTCRRSVIRPRCRRTATTATTWRRSRRRSWLRSVT